MVKSELVSALNEKLSELQVRDAELALNCTLELMVDALVQVERIEISGFGSFDCRHRSSRIARNPKMGKTVNLSAKVVVHFKPGKDMKDRMNSSRDKSSITA